MSDLSGTGHHATGEVCPGCDCELIVSTDGSLLLVECDCGSVSALGPTDLLPSAA